MFKVKLPATWNLRVVQQGGGGMNGTVPNFSFTTLMLAPALMRIQEKELENWVPATKAKAVAYEFVKQCDGLDGLEDGIIVDGSGNETGGSEIPGTFDQFSLLRAWVESGTAPGKSVTTTQRSNTDNSMPLCSYPTYPKYVSGDAGKASSYTCAMPWE